MSQPEIKPEQPDGAKKNLDQPPASTPSQKQLTGPELLETVWSRDRQSSSAPAPPQVNISRSRLLLSQLASKLDWYEEGVNPDTGIARRKGKKTGNKP